MFVEDNEDRLRMEYAQIRRIELLKKGKKVTIEVAAEIITREWTKFSDEQKINMQKFLDRRIKKRSIKEGF